METKLSRRRINTSSNPGSSLSRLFKAVRTYGKAIGRGTMRKSLVRNIQVSQVIYHLVEKGSSNPAAIENRRILEEVGINPLLNRENITWAPNVTGQHGSIPQGQLLEMLSPVRGDRDGVANVLQQWAEIAKARN